MLGFTEFMGMVATQLPLAITVILTSMVMMVNGCTDAPNAIATAISTRSLEVRTAIIMAAIMNGVGLFVMSMINCKVASTIMNMVDFGGDQRESLIALCAALCAIVTWSSVSWYFGLPTSESHALVAGLTGAAVAVHGSFSAINGPELAKVFWGLLVSTGLGFGLGFVICHLIRFLCRNANRQTAEQHFGVLQVIAAMAMAFMHGAQDGQKFLGVFLLGISLATGGATDMVAGASYPIWIFIWAAFFMGLGTSIGGVRIIKSVGMDMVKLDKYEGFSADLAGSLSLLFASLFGLPVSTTHTKTTAIMGVGAAKRLSNVNWSIVGDMVTAWLCAFPGCGLIGYLMAKLFLAVF